MSDKPVFNNFDLHIGQGKGGVYPVSVYYSPAGETAEPVQVPIVLDDEPMRRWLKNLQDGFTEREDLLGLGQRLTGYLLPPGPVRDLYQHSLGMTEAREAKLRLRLRISPPQLAALPWEFAYDEGRDDFMALNPHTALTRFHSQPVPHRSIASYAPVPILILISNPPGTFPLETTREVRNLIKALSRLLDRDRVRIDVLFAGSSEERQSIEALVADQPATRLLPDPASIDALRDALRQEYRVIHYIGHGVFDEEKGGALLLTDGQGNPIRVGAQAMARELRDSSVAVVVLNACQSATESAAQSFMGLAPNLIRVGVPAVVAMQYAIPDNSAVNFSRALYKALADGWPLDAAVTEGRKAISARLTPDDMDWGIPVLFMRSSDGVLWQEEAGQIAVGSYVLQIGTAYGSVVNAAPPGHRAAPQPRSAPVLLRPRSFADLLDRETEIDTATAALQSAIPVEFHGQAGLGKTVLLRHLAHHYPEVSFPDGVVYLLARGHPAADLLQSLYDAFYESAAPFKPTDTQMRYALQSKQALVLLDDVDLGRDEVEMLMSAAPGCAFLLASSKRHLWGEGRAVALHGLPADDALALVERELGRPLTPQERPAAEALCAALEGHPLRIFQTAAMAREEGLSLAEVARQVQTPAAEKAVTEQVVKPLSESEQRVLQVLAALGEAPLHTEHLAGLAKLAEVAPALESLRRRGLAQSHSPRHSLTGTVAQDLQRTLDLASLQEQALAYFTAWAEDHRSAPERLLEDADAMLHVLSWGVGAGRWAEVLRLGRAVESALAVGGRWDAWAKVLKWVLEAARALKDRAVEAWALHQLGSRAFCLGDAGAARRSLKKALRLRNKLGDRLGAAITRHNLDVFWVPPPPPLPSAPQAPAAPPPAPPPVPIGPAALGASLVAKAVPVLVAAAITVAGGLGIRHVVSRPTPTPPPTPTVFTPTSTSVETATPTPFATFSPTPTGVPIRPSTPTAVRTGTPTPTGSPTSTRTPTSTPTSTVTPTVTPTNTPTSTITPTATPTTTPTPKDYPAPVLIAPEDKAEIAPGAYANLWWAWDGVLAADEYFDVRFWQKGEPHNGVAWTKQGFYGVKGEAGKTYYWAIAVIRGQGGRIIEQLSPESKAHRLIWPSLTPTPTSTSTPTLTPTPTATPDTYVAVPQPTVPSDGQQLSCRSPVTLIWESVSDPSGIAGYYGKLWAEVDEGYWLAADSWGPVSGNQVDVDVICWPNYRWTVRAQDGAGNWSDWSEWSYFSILPDATPPPPPQPIQPTGGSVLSCRSSATLIWETVSDISGVSGYYGRLELEINPDYWYLEDWWGPVSDDRVTVEVCCGCIYRWHVQARDGAGNWSGWSERAYFSVDMY